MSYSPKSAQFQSAPADVVPVAYVQHVTVLSPVIRVFQLKPGAKGFAKPSAFNFVRSPRFHQTLNIEHGVSGIVRLQVSRQRVIYPLVTDAAEISKVRGFVLTQDRFQVEPEHGLSRQAKPIVLELPGYRKDKNPQGPVITLANGDSVTQFSSLSVQAALSESDYTHTLYLSWLQQETAGFDAFETIVTYVAQRDISGAKLFNQHELDLRNVDLFKLRDPVLQVIYLQRSRDCITRG